MIGSDVFAVDAWTVAERELHLELLGQTESLFALSNGHIGLRANLEEGEPVGAPGTFLNAFYEVHPLPYAEVGYGYPEDGQTMINVTNGKLIRLLVDDEPFDVRYGELVRHERVLDLRDGVLRREAEWISPAGQGIVMRSVRLVSFVQRSVAAIAYEVEVLDQPARLVMQSELVANEPGPEQTDDPRAARALRDALLAEHHGHHDLRANLVHRARTSGLRVSAGMDHVIVAPEDGNGVDTKTETDDNLARVTITTELEPGQTLRVVKFLAYGWSSRRSLPSVRDQVDAALASAKRTGWENLAIEQRGFLDRFWETADVELDGDAALQQAVRFAIFHVLQASVRAECRAIPAKGLTGSGYDGHTFWDTEAYTLRALTYLCPGAARDALSWRHSTMDLARERAHELHLEGSAFPWRTIRGQECSGYWPASTAAFHINADIADAVGRYLAANEDESFERGPALELAVETARLWRALGHHETEGGFRIDGVTGPDEYTALVNNNVYTNLMAARNLQLAAELAARHRDRAGELDVDEEEIASWRDAAEAIDVPFDDELGITPQSEGFTRYRKWDFDQVPGDEYPLLLHFHNYLLYSSQVVKQADLVFALYACGERFSLEQKRRDFEYYEKITVRDSSLSASIQAVVAAEVGHLALAYDYMSETAFIDLRDLAFNTRDGVHLAALAGSWLAAVAGFGGLRDHGGRLRFAPRLPPRLTRLAFGLHYRGRRLRVDVRSDQVHYRLLDGEPLVIVHCDEEVELEPGTSVSRAVVPERAQEAPALPEGRVPPRRHRDT